MHWEEQMTMHGKGQGGYWISTLNESIWEHLGGKRGKS